VLAPLPPSAFKPRFQFAYAGELAQGAQDRSVMFLQVGYRKDEERIAWVEPHEKAMKRGS